VPLLLVLAFVVVPIVELYVIVQVGQQIGVLPTIALLVLDSVLGAWLVRREGRRTWAAFRAALESSKLPAAEVADGALVIFGGALLLTPGFTTDLLGLLCVAPPSRRVLRRVLLGLLTKRLGLFGMVGRGAVRGARRRGSGPSGRTTGGKDVIEGEVVGEE
jgi:UPF0716 protein FxsA